VGVLSHIELESEQDLCIDYSLLWFVGPAISGWGEDRMVRVVEISDIFNITVLLFLHDSEPLWGRKRGRVTAAAKARVRGAHLEMSRGPDDIFPDPHFWLHSWDILRVVIVKLLLHELTDWDLDTAPSVVQEGGQRIVSVEAELEHGGALGPRHVAVRLLFLLLLLLLLFRFALVTFLRSGVLCC
jgi:hypothetical protein